VDEGGGDVAGPVGVAAEPGSHPPVVRRAGGQRRARRDGPVERRRLGLAGADEDRAEVAGGRNLDLIPGQRAVEVVGPRQRAGGGLATAGGMSRRDGERIPLDAQPGTIAVGVFRGDDPLPVALAGAGRVQLVAVVGDRVVDDRLDVVTDVELGDRALERVELARIEIGDRVGPVVPGQCAGAPALGHPLGPGRPPGGVVILPVGHEAQLGAVDLDRADGTLDAAEADVDLVVVARARLVAVPHLVVAR
jgi:hypothetical protein